MVDCWWHNLGPDLRALWESGDLEAFEGYIEQGLRQDPALAAMWGWRAKPSGIDAPFDLLTEVAQYDLTPVVNLPGLKAEASVLCASGDAGGCPASTLAGGGVA
ncbi:hypothetical protein [Streptomyces sp. NPDC001307]|uniref:hypothetical protein n=1 Tax=Streptomyces sp. NPDC001307 TaxID=3364560 RepID=UPI0036A45390